MSLRTRADHPVNVEIVGPPCDGGRFRLRASQILPLTKTTNPDWYPEYEDFYA